VNATPRHELPAPLVEADTALHEMFRRVHFSKFLNPANAPDARRAFDRGAAEPPFAYRDAAWADEEMRRLDALAPPEDHPLGRVLIRAIARTRLLIRALRDRTPEAFDALARAAAWYPDAEHLALASAQIQQTDGARFILSAVELAGALREALEGRSMGEWSIEMDPVMSARVLVDGPKRILRVNPRARFRERDVRKLIVHEIDVHAVRSSNGARQRLHLFATGTPGSLVTEEGLALVAEERAGVQSPGTAWRQGLVVQAVDWARDLGFRDLYDRIAEVGGRSLAWGIAQRIKRGLAEPGRPGVYAKDVVYFVGYNRVRRWLDEGNPVGRLYVGKVGIDDPIEQWIEQGYIAPQPVPELFD